MPLGPIGLRMVVMPYIQPLAFGDDGRSCSLDQIRVGAGSLVAFLPWFSFITDNWWNSRLTDVEGRFLVDAADGDREGSGARRALHVGGRAVWP